MPRLIGQPMHMYEYDPTWRPGRGEANLAEKQHFFFLSVALLAQADEAKEFGPASGHSSDGAALHCATAHYHSAIRPVGTR